MRFFFLLFMHAQKLAASVSSQLLCTAYAQARSTCRVVGHVFARGKMETLCYSDPSEVDERMSSSSWW
jgi:hypothetical protein